MTTVLLWGVPAGRGSTGTWGAERVLWGVGQGPALRRTFEEEGAGKQMGELQGKGDVSLVGMGFLPPLLGWRSLTCV